MSQTKIETKKLLISLGLKIEKPFGYLPFRSRQRGPFIVTITD